MKKKIDVELLVRWAFREELPKRELRASPWDSVLSYGLRGGLAVQNHDPLRPQRYAWVGDPHPDALTIEIDVARLADSAAVDWDSSKKHLLGDLAVWANGNPLIGLGFSARALVTMFGRLGTRPDWMPEPPHVERIRHISGGWHVVQHLDDDGRLIAGRDRSRKLGRGARCPLQLVPSAAEYAHARAEWSVWHAGLVQLAELLSAPGSLVDHQVLPPAVTPAPWITGMPEPSRVLHARETPLSRGALGPVERDKRFRRAG